MEKSAGSDRFSFLEFAILTNNAVLKQISNIFG
jgi:hypothetical protein